MWKVIVLVLAVVILSVSFVFALKWVAIEYGNNKATALVLRKKEINELNQLSASLDRPRAQWDQKQLKALMSSDEVQDINGLPPKEPSKAQYKEKISQQIMLENEGNFFSYLPPFPILVLSCIGIILTRIITFLTDFVLDKFTCWLYYKQKKHED